MYSQGLLVLCHYLPNSADTGTHIGPNHLVLLDVKVRNYIELHYSIRFALFKGLLTANQICQQSMAEP